MRTSKLRPAALTVLAATAASVGILAAGARATTTTTLFAPVADSYVNENHPNTNFGTNSKLKAERAPILRAYLRFDVQGLSGTVAKATLRLNTSTGSTIGYEVRSVPNNSWGETAITYANAPPAAATVTDSSGPFKSGQWTAVDVTALVPGNGLVSLALTTQSTTAISLNSREATSTLRPQLIVSTTTDLRPANILSPTISGTAQDGQVLTADPGTWSGTAPITYAYKWRRCDTTGANCTDIVGASAQTYKVGPADVGATLRVLVTASNDLSGIASSAPTGLVEAAPPVNVSPPTVSGPALAGQTLTAANGTWNGTPPIAYSYRWQGCDSVGENCADILGATGQTYTLVSADVDTTVRVAVTASNSAGVSTAITTQTGLVGVGPVTPTNTSPPTISGTAQGGQTLAASSGTWLGTIPIDYAYRWRRCDTTGANCAAITGANAQTYTAGTADIGSTLRVAVTGSNSAGSNTELSAQTPTVTAAGSVGYWDQSFNGGGVAPTGSKPESKLWWNDGTWWASLWTTSAQAFHIFKLRTASQSWTDTGVALDERSGTRADALWDGSHLYVASHVFSTCGCSTSSSGYPSRLYRYSYDATTKVYTLDTGFPVQINNTKTETLVIDKDSTGTLWATWAQDNRVMVSHTQSGDDRNWVTPFVLPVSSQASNLNSDDISSVVAFGGNKIGVMWSNQTDSAMYFAYHLDGTLDSNWTASPAVKLPNYADDHINLKSLQSDASGRVFAITKTSLNDGATPNPADPIVLLLVYNPATGWSRFPVWRVSDGVTRPILLIDQSHQVLHLFATSSESGGSILEKTSPIGAISFLNETGTPFLKDAARNSLNNATSTKQSLSTATGLVILASNDATGSYWHNYEALP